MSHTTPMHDSGTELSDFLTPEQRIDAIADILSTIALRIVTKRHESKDLD